jgi:hypothetical protein
VRSSTTTWNKSDPWRENTRCSGQVLVLVDESGTKKGTRAQFHVEESGAGIDLAADDGVTEAESTLG